MRVSAAIVFDLSLGFGADTRTDGSPSRPSLANLKRLSERDQAAAAAASMAL